MVTIYQEILGRPFQLEAMNCTLASLGNDHGFISKEYMSIAMRPFGEAQSKACAQSGQYHAIVES